LTLVTESHCHKSN